MEASTFIQHTFKHLVEAMAANAAGAAAEDAVIEQPLEPVELDFELAAVDDEDEDAANQTPPKLTLPREARRRLAKKHILLSSMGGLGVLCVLDVSLFVYVCVVNNAECVHLLAYIRSPGNSKEKGDEQKMKQKMCDTCFAKFAPSEFPVNGNQCIVHKNAISRLFEQAKLAVDDRGKNVGKRETKHLKDIRGSPDFRLVVLRFEARCPATKHGAPRAKYDFTESRKFVPALDY